MKRQRIVFLTVALGIAYALGVAAALFVSSQSLAPTHYSVTTPLADSVITTPLADVRARLRDPDSAQFRNVKVTRDGVVCGEVNGKNAFGALAGFTPFVFTSQGLFILSPSSDLGWASYNGHCN